MNHDIYLKYTKVLFYNFDLYYCSFGNCSTSQKTRQPVKFKVLMPYTRKQ